MEHEILLQLAEYLKAHALHERDMLNTSNEELNFLTEYGYGANSKRIKHELFSGHYHAGRLQAIRDITNKINQLIDEAE